MFKYLLCLLLSSSSFFSVAQSYLIPYRTGNLWGFVDYRLHAVIAPKYDSVSLDHDHRRWTIYLNGKTGQINEFGDEIIPPIYDRIRRDPQYSELHYNYIYDGQKVGYANMDGMVIVEPKYENLIFNDHPYVHDQYDMKQFNFFTVKDDQYSLMDYKGEVFIDSITDISNQSDGKYLFQLDNKWGLYFIGYKDWLIPCKYDSLVKLPDISRGREERSKRQYYYYAELGEKRFFINREAKPVPATQHMVDSVYPTEDEIERIEDYDVVAPSAIVNSNGFQSITELGNPQTGLLEIAKAWHEKSIREITFTEEKGKIGVVIFHEDGWDKVIPTKYDDLLLCMNENGSLANQYLMLKKDGKVGLLDMRSQKIILEAIHDSIVQHPYRNIFTVYKEGKIGLVEYNKEFPKVSNVIIPPSFDRFITWQGIDGIIDRYKHITLYIFEKEGKKCLVDSRGNLLFED